MYDRDALFGLPSSTSYDVRTDPRGWGWGLPGGASVGAVQLPSWANHHLASTQAGDLGLPPIASTTSPASPETSVGLPSLDTVVVGVPLKTWGIVAGVGILAWILLKP